MFIFILLVILICCAAMILVMFEEFHAVRSYWTKAFIALIIIVITSITMIGVSYLVCLNQGFTMQPEGSAEYEEVIEPLYRRQ